MKGVFDMQKMEALTKCQVSSRNNQAVLRGTANSKNTLFCFQQIIGRSIISVQFLGKKC